MDREQRLRSGWELRRLADLGEVNRGRSRHRPRYDPVLYGGPYPFIQTGDVKASDGQITRYDQTYNEVGLAQSRLWPAGTLCITIAANIAETGILTFDACFPDSVVGFIADEVQCDVRFVEYAFRNLRVAIQHQASGSVQDNINLATLDRLRIPMPSLDEQRAIAHILGTLDDKIELNRRMNETLEAMARALFKSWFVDFDPVRAKAQGQTPPGMDPATAALFPSEFQESEVGPLPAGWRVGTLADVAELNSESWSAKNAPPTVNYVDLSNTKWGKVESTTHYTWADAPSRARRVLRPGDSVVGTVRPGNGSYALISDEGLTGSTGFAVLRPKAQDGIAFVYLAATSKQNIESLTHLADGGAYPAVRPDVVSATPVVIADEPVVAAFEKAARPLYLHIAHNDRESRTLSRTRDTLLPRLLSGELSLTQAEQVVEATA